MVVDTGVFIDFLRAKDKSKTILSNLPDSTAIFISAVTLYELNMGASNEQKKKDVNLLTESVPSLSFTREIAIEAADIYLELRKSNKLIEFRDIFIAATARVNDLPVLTLNKKHFSRIEGLRVLTK